MALGRMTTHLFGKSRFRPSRFAQRQQLNGLRILNFDPRGCFIVFDRLCVALRHRHLLILCADPTSHCLE